MKGVKGDKQVINVGAGVDTRPYWLSCLSHATYYWEIDTVSVIKYKHTILMGWRKKDNCHVLCVLFVQYQWMLEKNPLPMYCQRRTNSIPPFHPVGYWRV